MTVEQLKNEFDKITNILRLAVCSGETNVISHCEIDKLVILFKEMEKRIQRNEKNKISEYYIKTLPRLGEKKGSILVIESILVAVSERANLCPLSQDDFDKKGK